MFGMTSTTAFLLTQQSCGKATEPVRALRCTRSPDPFWQSVAWHTVRGLGGHVEIRSWLKVVYVHQKHTTKSK